MLRSEPAMRLLSFGVSPALCFFMSCTPKPEEADLVLTNGKIVTIDYSLLKAQALAAKDGLILAMGTDEDVKVYIGDATEVIDLEGKLTDITVLSRDILTTPEDEIFQAEVLYTIIDGKILIRK